jgi:hypothetical protein
MRDTLPPAADLDDLRWLVSPAADEVLLAAAKVSGELTTRLKRLRGVVSPERARLVLGQVELRRRGREKFAAAERMFFTQQGLEQATDQTVAGYKAARFAGHERIFDLCTGIGGDLLALAAVGSTTGFDRDPVSDLIAEANARALGHRGVSVREADVTSLGLAECDAWHIDPDRRPQGRRTTRVELHEPSAEALTQMLAKNPQAAIKLAPAATWPEEWCEQAEWEWISRGRQCRQLVAWFGSLAGQPGRHRATALGSAPSEVATFVGRPDDDVAPAMAIDRYVFEPDAAILAAKLSASFATSLQLQAVAAGIAYWTGPSPIEHPLLACFEVEELLPFDLKKLKSLLRDRDAGPLEIKVRGADHDPAELRKQLAPRGSTPYTLLLTRCDKRIVAILAKRRP